MRCLERVTGRAFEVESVDSEDYIKRKKEELDRNPEDGEAREDLVKVVGLVDANWETKPDFANELLGLKAEDLEQVVRRVVEAQQ